MYRFSRYKEQYRLNLQLAVPVVLSQVGHVIVQLADNIMVGRYGGDDSLPLAAVSLAGGLALMLMVTTMGLTFGLTPIVGELFAQSRCGKAAKYLQNGVLLYTVIGILATLLQLATIPLMSYMGQPADVVSLAVPYYLTLAATMLPMMIFFAFKQFLEGIGDTHTAMYCVIISNAVNICLNWLLIYGHWGMPELGVLGAGIATMISKILTTLLIVAYFFWAPRFQCFVSRLSRVNFSWGHIVKLLGLGTPIAAQIFAETSTFTISGIMLGWVGKSAMGANQIGITLANAAFMIVLAIGISTTIRISHCYGARNISTLRRATTAAWHLALAWNIFTAIVFCSLSRVLPQLFTSNQEVIDIASTIIICIGIFQIPDGIQCISIGVLRGMQDVRAIIPITFLSYWVLNIPIGYLCAFKLGMGAAGLYVGYIFGFSIAALLLIWRIRVGQRRLVGGYLHPL